MSIDLRNDGSIHLSTVVDTFNNKLDSLLTTECHRDKTASQTGTSVSPASTVLTVDAITATEDGYITAVNNISGVLITHMADDSAHLIADVADGYRDFWDGYASATSIATACTNANAIKVCLNKHYTSSGVHQNNDGTNTITSSDASDASSLLTLITEMRTDLNAHMASAGATQRYRIVQP